MNFIPWLGQLSNARRDIPSKLSSLNQFKLNNTNFKCVEKVILRISRKTINLRFYLVLTSEIIEVTFSTRNYFLN